MMSPVAARVGKSKKADWEKRKPRALRLTCIGRLSSRANPSTGLTPVAIDSVAPMSGEAMSTEKGW